MTDSYASKLELAKKYIADNDLSPAIQRETEMPMTVSLGSKEYSLNAGNEECTNSSTYLLTWL